jgi:hypothetical protein
MAFHFPFYPRDFLRRRFARQLREDGPPSTMVRLLTSNHVKDLQVIALFTILLWIVLTFTILVYGMTLQMRGFRFVIWHSLDMHFVRKIPAKILMTHVTLGAITAVGGAVLSWVYQNGSKRLGVVDQFACEIGVICRTCFIVDLPRVTVLMADQAPKKEPRNFSSKEEYTPVCDKFCPTCNLWK